MKIMYVISMFMLLIGASFAQVTPGVPPKPTTLLVTPTNDAGSSFTVTVLAINSGASNPTTAADNQQILRDCGLRPASEYNQCVLQAGITNLRGTDAYRIETSDIESIQNAHFRYQYFANGNWITITDLGGSCSDRATETVVTNIPSSPSGSPATTFTSYVARCTLPQTVLNGVSTRELQMRVDFIPEEGQNYFASNTRHTVTVSNAPTAAAQLGRTITDLVNSANSGGNMLFCLGAFLILGGLLATMYFSGQSPLSLLDLTTPKLPMPKGVAASGQVVLPFGYTEAKTMTNRQIAATAALSRTLTNGLLSESGVNANRNAQAIIRGAGSDQVTRDVAALGAMVLGSNRYGDLQRTFNGRTIEQFNSAQHQVVRQIIEAARERGGRYAYAAVNLQTYLTAKEAMKTYSTITESSGVHGRSLAAEKKINQVVSYAFGRYDSLRAVSASVSSFGRSTNIILSASREAVRGAPRFVRDTVQGLSDDKIVRTKGVEELARVRAERAAAAANSRIRNSAFLAAGAANDNERDTKFGYSYHVSQSMTHLYENLRKEAHADVRGYVMMQILRSRAGAKNLTFEEVMELATKPGNLRERLGLTNAAALAELEVEFRRILSNKATSPREQFDQLVKLAQRHGANIDPAARRLMDSIEAVEISPEPAHVKMISLIGRIEEHHNARGQQVQGARSDNAYICNVGGQIADSQVYRSALLRPYMHALETGSTHGVADGAAIVTFAHALRAKTINSMFSSEPDQIDPNAIPVAMRRVDLKAVAAAMRESLSEQFTEVGARAFEAKTGKSFASASLTEILHFSKNAVANDPHGGSHEAYLPDAYLKIGYREVHNEAGKRDSISEHLQMRTAEGKKTVEDPVVEAQMRREAHVRQMSDQEQGEYMQRLIMMNSLRRDFETRLSGAFGNNVYGTTHESARQLSAISVAYLSQILREKGVPPNNIEAAFLETIDLSKSAHKKKLAEMISKYNVDFQKIQERRYGAGDLASSEQVYVRMYEGGYVPFHKCMQLAYERDQLVNGTVSIRNKNGRYERLMIEDVPVRFEGRADLMEEWMRVQGSRNKEDWLGLIAKAKNYKNGVNGEYDPQREKEYAAVLWRYGRVTGEYSAELWKDSAVTITARKDTVELSPTIARIAGIETPRLNEFMHRIDTVARNVGEYGSRVFEKGVGDYYYASYNTGYVSELQRRAHMEQVQIMQAQTYGKMTDAERKAANKVIGLSTGIYTQLGWAFDRAAVGTSLEAMNQSYMQFGPGWLFPVNSYYAGYYENKLSQRMANFAYYWPLDLTRSVGNRFGAIVRRFQRASWDGASRSDLVTNTPWESHTGYGDTSMLRAVQTLFRPFSYEPKSKVGKALYKVYNYGAPVTEYKEATGESSNLVLDQSGNYGARAEARIANANPHQNFMMHDGSYRMNPRINTVIHGPQRSEFFANDPGIKAAGNEIYTQRLAGAVALGMRKEQSMQQYSVLAGQHPVGGFVSPVHFLLTGGGGLMGDYAPTSLIPQAVSAIRDGRPMQIGGVKMPQAMNDNAKQMANPTVKYQKCATCGERVDQREIFAHQANHRRENQRKAA